MEHTAEELLQKAEERGYTVHMHSGDHSWYSLMKKDSFVNLQLWTKTGDFSLNYMVGFFKLTTDKCGSFMYDNHFNGMENQFEKIVNKLRGE